MARLFVFSVLMVSMVNGIRQRGWPDLRNRNSVGPCILSECPDGFKCDDNLCFPDMTQMERIGQCVNTLCPESYFCHNDSCLRPIPKQRAGSTAIGPCVNLQCPEKYMCEKTDYKCYPMA